MDVTSKNTLLFYLTIIIFFIFNPLITLIVIFLAISINYASIKLYNNENLIKLCCICSAVFIGGINAVKIPENDLVWYLDTYKNASITNYIDYIRGIGLNMYIQSIKDPVYTTLVWCMNRLLGGNVVLFKFFITLLNYLLLNAAMVKFCRHFKFSVTETVSGIFLMCFIPYIFTMSLQLVRQFLAGSLLVYLLVDVCFYKKINWLLIVCMGLIHSSVIFFIPFLVFPFLDKPVGQNKIYYGILLILLVGFQLISGVLLNTGLFTNNNPLNYAISRASQSATFGSYLPVWKVIIAFFIGIFHFYFAYIGIQKIKLDMGVRRYCNLLIFLSVFMLLNLHQSELSFRFFSYLFPFFPFMIVWIFHSISFKFRIISTIPFIIGMLLFWIEYLDIGTWTYKLPANIWITPIFSYFFS